MRTGGRFGNMTEDQQHEQTPQKSAIVGALAIFVTTLFGGTALQTGNMILFWVALAVGTALWIVFGFINDFKVA